MKKNRPGVNVTVIARPEAQERVAGIFFTEGTTLGVRYHEVRREALERRFVSVLTRYGKVSMKEGLLGGKVVNRAPELEDCRKLAIAKGVPLKEVQQAALSGAGRAPSSPREERGERAERSPQPRAVGVGPHRAKRRARRALSKETE
jgi:hypothetical protein